MKTKWFEFWAKFPELERQATKKNCVLAAALMCIPMVLALVIFVAALMLSGCAVANEAVDDFNAGVDAAPYIWTPSGKKTATVTVASDSIKANGFPGDWYKIGTKVQVFSCQPNYALITEHNWLDPDMDIFLPRSAFAGGYDPCQQDEP